MCVFVRARVRWRFLAETRMPNKNDTRDKTDMNQFHVTSTAQTHQQKCYVPVGR